MKKFGWVCLACLAVPFMARSAEEEAETIPQKELRVLLKDDATSVGPAGELVFAMSPEEKAKLRELVQGDRDAARKMILDKLEENRQRRQDANRKIREVAKQFRESGDEAQKATLRAELRKLLAEQFERTSAEIAVRLKIQELRLAVVRKAYEERQTKSGEMIDAQLEKLTRKQANPERKKPAKKQTGTPTENVQ